MLFLKIKVVSNNSYHHLGGCCTFSLAKCALNIVSPFPHHFLALFALFHALLQIQEDKSLIHRLLRRTIYLWIAHMRAIYRENVLFFRARSLSWVSLAPTSLTIRAMDKWRSRECFLLLKLNILKRHLFLIFILIDTVLFDKILCLKEPWKHSLNMNEYSYW